MAEHGETADTPVFEESDSTILKATGRSQEEWFELLDEAGASSWDHATIARWLGGKHEVDAWWAQGVTIRYEQSRAPGHTGEGSFEVSHSKSISAAATAVWPYVTDDDLRRDWLDLELNALSQSSASIRFDGGERTRVTFFIEQAPPTKSGRPRCRLSVTHTRLQRESVQETTEFWTDSLMRLSALFE